MPAGSMTRVFRGRQSTSRKLNFRQVKQVQKIINANKKLKSLWLPLSLALDTTPALFELTAIPEGDDFNERDTDKILLQSLKIQYSIRKGTATTAQVFRVLIVRSKIGPLVVASMPALAGEPDQDKMQVLYDEIISCSVTPFDQIQRFIFKSFRKRNIPHLTVTYDDDTSATAAVSNPIYMHVIGDLSGSTVNLTGYSKIKWFDAQ